MPQCAARVPLHIDRSARTAPPADETLAGLGRPTPPLRPSASAMSAHEAFFADATLYAVAVVDEHGTPIGLINRFRFRETLWQQFGDEILKNRPVAMIMDRSPLVLDEHAPLFLERLGCDLYQGHLLSPPLPASEMEQYLKARHARVQTRRRSSLRRTGARRATASAQPPIQD